MNLSSGRVWPYAIGASILFIFGACVATIVVASKLPVEASDTYMMNYHQADASANELIEAQIAFDKKYKLEYVNNGISLENTILQYKLSDREGNPVENAEIKVVLTRPNNHKYDQEFVDPKREGGVYTFSSIALPQEGRWDIMAKISVDDLSRFYNIKADTRYKHIQEY